MQLHGPLNCWRLLPQRIALHEPSGTAVIADVHLGYNAVRQRLGDAIPSRGVWEELQPLAQAARTHAIARLVVAGDLFERGADGGIARDFLACLAEWRIELLAVTPGNHDRGIEGIAVLPIFADGFDLAGWHVAHGDKPVSSPQSVIGHWHPAVRLKRAKAPCFLVSERRIVLPAFSLDAAGVDVQKDIRWQGWRRLAIDGEQVLEVPG
jgi:putative SbcD/Mre11-related phosphoesterase